MKFRQLFLSVIAAAALLPAFADDQSTKAPKTDTAVASTDDGRTLPEPGTLALLALGLGAIGLSVSRRRQQD